jgi:hypothetical protein
VDRVLVVLTRADLVVDPSAIIADTRRKLAPLLGRPESELPVVAVSNRAYFDYLASNDPADLAASNFVELEAALWELAERDRTRVLVERSARQLRATLERLRAPLESERAASDEGGQAAAARIEAQLTASAARLEQLSSESATWRKALTRALEDARLEATDVVSASWRKLNQTFANEYLNDDRLLRDSQKLSALLSRDVALVTSANAQTIETLARSVAEEIERISGLELGGPELSTFAKRFDATPAPAKAATSTTAFDRGFVYVRNASMGAGAGIFAGNAAGMALGAVGASAFAGAIAPIVLALGVAAGVRFALTQIKKEDRSAQREAIRTACGPYLQDAQAQANSNLARSLRQLEREFIEAFASRLLDESATLAETRKALASARGRSVAEAKTRVAELNRALEPLERLEASLASLVSREPVLAAAAPSDEAWADV